MRRRFGFLFRLLGKLDRWLSNRSRSSVLAFSLALGLMIGALDRTAASGLLIIYVLPVAIAGWYGGRREAFVIAVYGATAWLLATQYGTGFTEFHIEALWPFAARLFIFLVLAQTIAGQRESMRQQRDLMQFIVHDLRSPISSSITGLETLQLSSETMDPIDAEMVSLALVSNQRALRLVNSLLDLAKLENGKMSITPERVNMNELIDSSFEEIALWAKSDQIELVKEVELEEAELDRNLTSRILVNLLSNAIKFSPPGSKVTVSVVPCQGDCLRFAVQDQGPGIPSEYLPTIFDPFSQVKGTKGGTGLGLTFCRLATAAQGGKIWVESTVGKGTSMKFILPRHGKIVVSDEV